MSDVRSIAGGTLVVGLPGPALDDRSARRLERLSAAGVILFARNLEEPAQTVELLASVRERLERPALLAIDQEGGAVSRLEPWIGPTPTGARLAREGVERSREFGEATGEALRRLGFNLDFAPVVDLCGPDVANGIGARSYGTDAARVAAIAGAFLDGLQGRGVAGCLKHFPGLGDTRVDSHVELPRVLRDEGRLRDEDLLPYRALKDRSAAVMVGHGHYVAIDGDGPLPATCSRRIVGDWLRARVGFAGLAVSDDMEMGAVAPRDEDGAAAVEAIDAGLDLLLYCADLDRAERAHARLVERAARDERFAARLRDAAARVEATARLWPAPSPREDELASLAAPFRSFA